MCAQRQKFESLEVRFPAKPKKVTLCLLSAQIVNFLWPTSHHVFHIFVNFLGDFAVKMAPVVLKRDLLFPRTGLSHRAMFVVNESTILNKTSLK